MASPGKQRQPYSHFAGAYWLSLPSHILRLAQPIRQPGCYRWRRSGPDSFGALVIGVYSDRVGGRPAMILSLAMKGSAIIALALRLLRNALGI
jgi:hypothetical protein